MKRVKQEEEYSVTKEGAYAIITAFKMTSAAVLQKMQREYSSSL